MTYTHPNQLPPEWRERFDERAAIIHEGCKFPDTVDGHREANRRAFAVILQEIKQEQPR